MLQGSTAYLDQDRRNSISPGSPADKEREGASRSAGPTGERERGDPSRSGPESKRNRSPEDFSDESSHVNARQQSESNGTTKKKKTKSGANREKGGSNGQADDSDNESNKSDADLVVDVSNDEDSRDSPVPKTQQNGSVVKEEVDRDGDSQISAKKPPNERSHSPRSGRSSASSSTSSRRDRPGKLISSTFVSLEISPLSMSMYSLICCRIRND